jgi:hypothetical protein
MPRALLMSYRAVMCERAFSRRREVLRRVGGARVVVFERPPHCDEVRQMTDPGWRDNECARNG